MYWNCAKILLVSTATAVVTSQVVTKVYRYLTKTKNVYQSELKTDCVCNDTSIKKNHEINDVILFSDNPNNQIVAISPNKALTTTTTEEREISCYKLIRYIKSARETLDVCMFLITSKEITETIIRLGQTHVLVRIIVDDNMAHTPQSQVRKLQEYSHIQVQPKKDDVIMHHKFCIIDGPKAIKRKKILKAHAEKINIHVQNAKTSSKTNQKIKTLKGFIMSGSLNWSTQAMISNRENVIITSNSNIVNKLEKEFQSLWIEKETALLDEKEE